MSDETELERFSAMVLPHLDAAYNMARWLTRNDQDAQDVVQEALLRALRYFASFRGDRVRPWLLQIVHHTTWSWLQKNRPTEQVPWHDDDDEPAQAQAPEELQPPALLARKMDREQINRALASLPAVYREVLVLRELEDLAYKDIARIADIPVGTVMSRLARARRLLREALAPHAPLSSTEAP